MTDDDECLAVSMHFLNVGIDLLTELRMHTSKRLIKEYDLGVEHQYSPQLQKLLLTTGEVLSVLIGQVLNS